FLALGAGALAGGGSLTLMLVLFVQLSWPHTEPLGNPEFGINFSCNYAEFLFLEASGGAALPDDRPGRAAWCASTLGSLIEATGARHVRLSVEWAQIEPAQGRFDFTLLDALLAEAEAGDARVLLTVGIKAQRHPEYYIPAWALALGPPPDGAAIGAPTPVGAHALAMVAAVAAHAALSPAIDAWAAENEPYVVSARSNGWTLDRDFVRAEAEAIRAADPLRRPVSIGHAQHFVFDRRWQHALADGDVLTTSIYPFRNYGQFVVPILEIGPFAPNYAHHAREARDAGKEFWITEMQAEPWTDDDIRPLSPQNPSANLTARNFRRNIEYARRSGASRVYLWGAEWWLYQRERFGDGTWLDLGRAAIAGAAPATR
ncbi:MAG: beta-galactosidase, partial [Tepidiformaceae bacterium]